MADPLPTTFPESDSKPFTVIVTGANSGVGFAICTRLIEQNLKSTSNSRLLLIATARSGTKGAAAVSLLTQHARTFQRKLEKSACAAGLCPVPVDPVTSGRVVIKTGRLDLTSLPSVRQFVGTGLAELGVGHVDVVVMNAGIGGWSGVDWVRCFRDMFFVDWVGALTYPTYKLAHVGLVTNRHLAPGPGPGPGPGKSGEDDGPSPDSGGKKKGEENDREEEGEGEPPLGQVFCANVFGHYMLGHYLVPFLSRAFPGYGRMVWMGSLEAYKQTLAVGDLQGLRSLAPYESSKRLTDVLALSSGLPETAPFVEQYLGGGDKEAGSAWPAMYLCHPGICGTSIFPLVFPLPWLMMLGFWVARLLGGAWHTLTPYNGATAPVWVATAAPAVLAASERAGRVVSVRLGAERGGKAIRQDDEADETDEKEEEEEEDGEKDEKGRRDSRSVQSRKCKWGSGCTRAGAPLVLPTEVEGWAVRGIPGERPRMEATWRTGLAGPQTGAERDQFGALAVECWGAMERLRAEWEGLLDRAGC